MTSKFRSSSSSKKQLKEKVVLIYDSFFKGDDPSAGSANFWNEFFLLKPKLSHIENLFLRLPGEQLVSLKENFNAIFHKCVKTLQEDNQIRIVNALQTLIALIRGVYSKSDGTYGFDIINILMGFNSAETAMQSLIDSLCNIITGEYVDSLKKLGLKFILILVTLIDNVSQNTLLEYLMINSVYEAIVQVLVNMQSRQLLGYDAELALTVLVNYRKYEGSNPYIVKLSILDDELALNGYGQIVATSLTDFNREHCRKQSKPKAGILAAITNMVGSMFVAEEEESKTTTVRTDIAVLLALYEAVHLNRNFITTLTHSQPNAVGLPVSITGGGVNIAAESPLEMTAKIQVPSETLVPLIPASVEALGTGNEEVLHTPPTNLLVTFLEYCSIVMQNTKDEASYSTVKLCFIILTCIAEDQYANSLMHDANMVFKVQLHKLPMRHRKAVLGTDSPSRPLACALLDVMVEFVLSHMMKNLPIELYTRCLDIILRLLCYQKRCRVRLQYQWSNLWSALIALLRFLLSNETHLLRKNNIFPLAAQMMNIFNLFITYGDTFLPAPTNYDELYYELIRMHQVFDNMYSMALRYTTNETDIKDSAVRVTNSLVNVRAITNHFTPKIDAWMAQNRQSSLTEYQVLEVVRSNYDSLTLKLHESLDQYERYAEKPREVAFFTQLLRNVVADCRQRIDLSSIGQLTVLHELSNVM